MLDLIKAKLLTPLAALAAFFISMFFAKKSAKVEAKTEAKYDAIRKEAERLERAFEIESDINDYSDDELDAIVRKYSKYTRD